MKGGGREKKPTLITKCMNVIGSDVVSHEKVCVLGCSEFRSSDMRKDEGS